MKLVATILVAAFVVTGGISLAFADCAGHTKAELAKVDDSRKSSDRQAKNDALTAGIEQVAQQTQSVKSLEKK